MGILSSIGKLFKSKDVYDFDHNWQGLLGERGFGCNVADVNTKKEDALAAMKAYYETEKNIKVILPEYPHVKKWSVAKLDTTSHIKYIQYRQAAQKQMITALDKYKTFEKALKDLSKISHVKFRIPNLWKEAAATMIAVIGLLVVQLFSNKDIGRVS